LTFRIGALNAPQISGMSIAKSNSTSSTEMLTP